MAQALATPAEEVPVGLTARGREWLPSGAGRSGALFDRTHRTTCALLWAHVPVLVVFGAVRGLSVQHQVADVAATAGLGALASWRRLPARWRSVAAAVGLMTCAAVVVHLSQGRTEAHFHYFVLLVVLSRYDDWWPFAAAIMFTLAEHVGMAVVAPHDLFSTGERIPVQVAVHVGYVVAASVASLAVWRAHEEQRDRDEAALRRTADELRRSEAAHRDAANAFADAEERFRLAFDHAPIGQALVRDDGCILRVNAAFCRIVGREEHDLRLVRFHDITHPDDVRLDDDLFKRCRDGELDTYRIAKRYLRPDGSVVHGQLTVAAIRTEVGPPTFLGQVEDVTARMAAEARLVDAEERQRRVLEGLADAVVTYRLGPDGELAPTWANPAAAELFRRALGSPVVPPPHEVVLVDEDGEPLPPERRPLRRTAAEGERITDLVVGMRSAGGATTWVRCSTVPLMVDGEPGALLSMSDLTEVHHARAALRDAAERLAHQATHDDLTGLANRALLLERLHRASAGRRRCALLFVDLDRFKDVNDTLGHGTGDRLLVAVAERLREAVRPGDTVGRLGGDEFVVLLEGVRDEGEARAAADRVLAALEQPIDLGSRTVAVSASIGIGLAGATPGVGDGVEALLAAADLALYQAKERGRARAEVYDVALGASVQRRVEAEDVLRACLDGREGAELDVAYQPIVRLADLRSVGAEALLRVCHQGRTVPLGEVIKVAEASGLIVPLGAGVLDLACAEAARWRQPPDEPLLGVSVNVSPRQLASPGLAELVERTLLRHHLKPSLLTLEVTESAILDVHRAGPALQDLRDLGVRLALDDFGTGWSSLAALRRHPFTEVKIDRSFVAGVAAGGEDAAVVQAIVEMGHALGAQVVAEGVETAAQVTALRRLGCELAQGHRFGHPGPLPWAQAGHAV